MKNSMKLNKWRSCINDDSASAIVIDTSQHLLSSFFSQCVEKKNDRILRMASQKIQKTKLAVILGADMKLIVGQLVPVYSMISENIMTSNMCQEW